jgi:hypothetical protein
VIKQINNIAIFLNLNLLLMAKDPPFDLSAIGLGPSPTALPKHLLYRSAHCPQTHSPATIDDHSPFHTNQPPFTGSSRLQLMCSNFHRCLPPPMPMDHRLHAATENQSPLSRPPPPLTETGPSRSCVPPFACHLNCHGTAYHERRQFARASVKRGRA